MVYLRPSSANESVVVKLFNVIQQSQTSVSAATDKAKANRGTGKPTLAAPVVDSKRGKGKKDNIIGRGKESESSLYSLPSCIKPLIPFIGTVDKDDFFNMIRAGGVVSKA
jgi:hypothetical protein